MQKTNEKYKARLFRAGSGSVACRGRLTDYQRIAITMKPLLNRSCSVLDRMLQSAFPDDGHTPAKSLEHLHMSPVAIDIALEFLSPKLLVGSGGGGVATTFVSMPEAAVDKHHRPVLREHKVRGAGQLFDMKSISESSGKQKGAKRLFRPGVLSANARHHAAALWSGRDAHGLEAFLLDVCRYRCSHIDQPVRSNGGRCEKWYRRA